MPACTLYFALATVFYRWLFLYVYEPEFDCAGSFWYDLFDCSVFGLFCSNVTLMALATFT
ncbi:TAGLN3, partial [Symbiodinium sp. CCMP2456]